MHDHEIRRVRCAQHFKFATRAAAEKALSQHALNVLHRGSDWQKLNVFACGDHWHIGRDKFAKIGEKA